MMLDVVQDITEHVRTRETLRVQAETVRESEERYRAFVEHSSEGIWRLEFSPPLTRCGLSRSRSHWPMSMADSSSEAHMYQLHAPDDFGGKTLDFMLPSSDPGCWSSLCRVSANSDDSAAAI